ncbi:MAG: hypothetical protein ABJE95_03140 [Byssovorax sp.]
MLELGLSRALVISTLTLAATLASGAAQAADPPPPVLPAATPPEASSPPPAARPAGFDLGYAAPPPAYGPPASYGLLPEQQPEYPPEMQMRSPGLVAGGVVLLSFGVVGLFAGSALVSAHDPTSNQQNTCINCSFDGSGGSSTTAGVVLKPGFQTAGIGTLIGSVVAIGAAIPLIAIGAKKVPYVNDASPTTNAARLTPSIGIGPAGATVTWQF